MFQVSPGVNVSEVDLTTVVPAVSTTVGAIAGTFGWGPAEERVLISSENELAKRFLKPSQDNFETWFTAGSFLAYGNALWVVRAIDDGAMNAQANVASANAVQIKNDDDYETTTLDTDILYYARFPGAAGNSLKISVCDSSAAFQSTTATTATANTIVEIDVASGANQAIITITNADANNTIANTEITRIANEISVGDRLLIGDQYMSVANVVSVAAANGIGTVTANLTTRYRGFDAFAANTGITRQWEYASLFDRAPGTSDFVTTAGGTSDELHLVVVDEDGVFTGERGTILETFPAASRATDAKGSEGGSTYYKTVINNTSQYLRWGADRTGAASALAAAVVASSNPKPLTMSLAHGVDAEDESTIANADLARAYDLYKDPEAVDISLLLAGKTNAVLAEYLISNIAESRLDCVVFLSPERSDVVNNVDAVTDVIAFRDLLPSTSYAVMDSGYKYMYDRYNDTYRYVPLNGDVAGLCVRTDTVRDPWYSPAGYNRGQIKNIVKLAFNPNKAARDELYKKGINPVVSFAGEGTLLYGDKTMLSKSSAFNRINVRRLFIILEKAIARASKSTLFEFNDEFTRAQFRNMVEPFLRDVQGRRGIEDFRVVCDATNNTPEVVNQNRFVGDIYVKPKYSINYIQLNFVAVRSGVSFEEVVGQF